MAFHMTPMQIAEFSTFANLADNRTRRDLAKRRITSENDYTSQFLGRLSDMIEDNSATGLTGASFKLPGSAETKLGCDAAIVLHSGGESKVAIFEAKYPRLKTRLPAWDYPQTTGTSASHFSSQLARQAAAPGWLAKFEMFFCEYESTRQPTHFENEGSTCVRHGNAVAFMNSRAVPSQVWTNTDLQAMFTAQPTFTTGELMLQFAACRDGQPKSDTEVVMLFNQYGIPPQGALHITALPEPEQDPEPTRRSRNTPG